MAKSLDCMGSVTALAANFAAVPDVGSVHAGVDASASALPPSEVPASGSPASLPASPASGFCWGVLEHAASSVSATLTAATTLVRVAGSMRRAVPESYFVVPAAFEISVNALGSAIAMSLRILRSRPTFAFFRPFIRRE